MPIVAADLPLQRLWQWERERADRIYLTQPLGEGRSRDFTWKQAMDEARRMAAHLQSLGLKPGARIAIMAKNSAWWYLADYAILMAGHVSVPLYASLTADTVRAILEHSEARVCFVGKLDHADEMEAGLPAAVTRIRLPQATPGEGVPWDDIVANTAPLAGTPTRPADDLATIIYTSGTTGMSKGVMHTFAAVAVAGKTVADTFGMRADDRFMSYLPTAHVADRWGTQYTALQGGCRVFFIESIETFLRDVAAARPTIFAAVPRLWAKFQQGVFARLPKQKLDRLLRIPLLNRWVKRKILKQLGFDQVRIALSGGAPLPPEVYGWYRGLGLELLELYGMTENFGLSHSARVGEVRIGYVGQPWPGVAHRLSSEGEVQVQTPAATIGYYKAPDLTRELLGDDGWIRTGDLGEVDERNRLRIVGRIKEQFKTSKGKYVSPAPIENLLSAHPFVEATCVCGAGLSQPFALVMLPGVGATRWDEAGERESLSRSLAEHVDAINARIAKHEQLGFVVVVVEQWTVDNNLITPSMKIKRASIEKRYGERFAGWAEQNRKVIWA
ncbi:MAG: AMP-binding protein [Chiayiivirga sp.]|nr:AMP-binding protein [Chiayiivirga sp.]